MSSLPRRFAAKLASNIVGLIVGAGVVLMVPRALGAGNYGTAEFLLAFFSGIVGFLDVGTSNGYYAWLSRRPEDAGLVRGYLIFAVAIILAIVAVILLSYVTEAPARWLWPDIAISSVLAGCLAAWLAWMQQIMQKTVDARGLTVSGELRILSCRSIAAMLIVVAAMRNILTYELYLAYLVGLPLAIALLLGHALKQERMGGVRMWRAVRNASPDWRNLAHDFNPYVVPMLGFTLISTFATVADRWMLQQFGGAVQQGLYSLASRTAGLCFVFSLTMTQLLMREFAMAWERGEKSAINKIFSRFAPPLYAVSAMISVFVAWHARDFITLLGGETFGDGMLTMTILALYPMHQTLGQLTGAVFYGTGSMRIYSQVGIAGALLSLIALWVAVAPYRLGGLDLGSLGLALKMFGTQLIMVNVMLFFVSRHYGVHFFKELKFQLLPPLGSLPMVAISGWTAANLLGTGLVALLASAFIYAALGSIFIWFAPGVFGLQEGDVRRIYLLLKGFTWRRV